MTPDLAARNILCAAYLYYVLDANPIMTDQRYDELSVYVADHWDDLNNDRKWALGDPGSTRASGAHFRFTSRTISGARQAHFDTHGRYPAGDLPEKWLERDDGVRYVTAVSGT